MKKIIVIIILLLLLVACENEDTEIVDSDKIVSLLDMNYTQVLEALGDPLEISDLNNGFNTGLALTYEAFIVVFNGYDQCSQIVITKGTIEGITIGKKESQLENSQDKVYTYDEGYSTRITEILDKPAMVTIHNKKIKSIILSAGETFFDGPDKPDYILDYLQWVYSMCALVYKNIDVLLDDEKYSQYTLVATNEYAFKNGGITVKTDDSGLITSVKLNNAGDLEGIIGVSKRGIIQAIGEADYNASGGKILGYDEYHYFVYTNDEGLVDTVSCLTVEGYENLLELFGQY